MAAKNKPNEIYISRIYDAPVKMVWGYTIVSSRPVYANTGGVNGDSVDPEWREIDHNELMLKACSYLGLNISDGDLLQFSEAKQNPA